MAQRKEKGPVFVTHTFLLLCLVPLTSKRLRHQIPLRHPNSFTARPSCSVPASRSPPWHLFPCSLNQGCSLKAIVVGECRDQWPRPWALKSSCQSSNPSPSGSNPSPPGFESLLHPWLTNWMISNGSLRLSESQHPHRKKGIILITNFGGWLREIMLSKSLAVCPCQSEFPSTFYLLFSSSHSGDQRGQGGAWGHNNVFVSSEGLNATLAF